MIDEVKLNLAQESFISHDYQTASDIYNDLLKEEPHNSYLLLNSGTSDYEIQNIGSALTKLYKAKKIMPRNKTLKNNIQLIENKIQLNNPQIFTLNFISFTESLVLVLILNILFLLRSRISQNKIWKFSISFLFFISLILSSLCFIEQKASKYAFVTSISADAYSGNNTAYSKLYELLDGQLVKVIRKEDEWSQIKYNNSLGWIENEHIVLI